MSCLCTTSMRVSGNSGFPGLLPRWARSSSGGQCRGHIDTPSSSRCRSQRPQVSSARCGSRPHPHRGQRDRAPGCRRSGIGRSDLPQPGPLGPPQTSSVGGRSLAAGPTARRRHPGDRRWRSRRRDRAEDGSRSGPAARQGQRSRQGAVLAQCRLLVHPSMLEGWGLVVMEAAAYGKPTLAFDVQGIRDSVVHETTGVLANGIDDFVQQWIALATRRCSSASARRCRSRASGSIPLEHKP